MIWKAPTITQGQEALKGSLNLMFKLEIRRWIIFLNVILFMILPAFKSLSGYCLMFIRQRLLWLGCKQPSQGSAYSPLRLFLQFFQQVCPQILIP